MGVGCEQLLLSCRRVPLLWLPTSRWLEPLLLRRSDRLFGSAGGRGFAAQSRMEALGEAVQLPLLALGLWLAARLFGRSAGSCGS